MEGQLRRRGNGNQEMNDVITWKDNWVHLKHGASGVVEGDSLNSDGGLKGRSVDGVESGQYCGTS